MWGSRQPLATRHRCDRPAKTRPGRVEQATLRTLPGPERPNLPDALALLAGLTLHPGFRRALHVAGKEIAAGLAVLVVGGSNRRDRSARPRIGILPRLACVLAAPVEDLGHRCARIGEVRGGR